MSRRGRFESKLSRASLMAQLVKNPPAMQRPGSIPGLGRSSGEGKGYPLQYSGLENSMDCSPWGREESDTTEGLSLHFTSVDFKGPPTALGHLLEAVQ